MTRVLITTPDGITSAADVAHVPRIGEELVIRDHEPTGRFLVSRVENVIDDVCMVHVHLRIPDGCAARPCNGGTRGPWCGPSTHVSNDDGLEFFTCTAHSTAERTPIADWFTARGMSLP